MDSADVKNEADVSAQSGTPPPRLTVIHAVHEQAAAVHPFAHALRIAVAAKGELEIVDVRRKSKEIDELGVRKTLERWGMLPAGSDRDDVDKLGLHIKKIIKHGGSKQDVAERLQRHHHDILVVGTSERRGIGHLFGADLGEYLARYIRQTTLYVPLGVEGFVNADTGALRLNTVLMPIAEEPSPEPAFGLLRRLLSCLGGTSPQVHGIHAGDVFPFVSAASLEGLSWAERSVRGSIEPAIVDAARELSADLIVMSTNGRDSLPQKILGSITEHVLRFAPCPVLAVAVRQE